VRSSLLCFVWAAFAVGYSGWPSVLLLYPCLDYLGEVEVFDRVRACECEEG